MNFNDISIQSIENNETQHRKIALDVLRLDTIDPIISGNKWFKLKYYLKDALDLGHKTIATFGGAWSNHIVATAFVAKEHGLQSVGIIRGEKPTELSATLQMAQQAGMRLIYVSRNDYRHKENIKASHARENWYWINEGGYGKLGAKGASEILKTINHASYTHIIAAVGTGTMLAGLLMEALPHQRVIGISSMKGNNQLETDVLRLANYQGTDSRIQILHQYHFGGYGKHPQPLIDFVNDSYQQHHLPLDIVYTGKTFYAVQDLIKNDFFIPGSKLLMIHSGGLQGNSSLPPKLLAF